MEGLREENGRAAMAARLVEAPAADAFVSRGVYGTSYANETRRADLSDDELVA